MAGVWRKLWAGQQCRWACLSGFRSFLSERTAASISLIAADTSSNVPSFTTFKSSSAVFPSLDGLIFSIVLKIPLPNFRCLCYNLFHGDVPHFRSFFAMSKQILPRKARPHYFYSPLRLSPAGARYFSRNYFTLKLIWRCSRHRKGIHAVFISRISLHWLRSPCVLWQIWWNGLAAADFCFDTVDFCFASAKSLSHGKPISRVFRSKMRIARIEAVIHNSEMPA